MVATLIRATVRCECALLDVVGHGLDDGHHVYTGIAAESGRALMWI